jgi:predicted Fe-S protein YdhL (DUF1289 family)
MKRDGVLWAPSVVRNWRALAARRDNMTRRRQAIVLFVIAIGLFCLAGCGAVAPAQGPVEELEVMALAEAVTEESDLLVLVDSAAEELELLAPVDSITSETSVPVTAANMSEVRDPTMAMRLRSQLLERRLGRLDRIIERGQIAEGEKAQILERVRMMLEGSLSDEEKAQILERVEARIGSAIERGQIAEGEKAQILERVRMMLDGSLSDEEKADVLERVEARIDRVIEQGRGAQQRRAQVLRDVEAWLEELVDRGLLTAEQKDHILQRLSP